LDFVLVICTTEFSTFWKTSGNDDTEEEGGGEGGEEGEEDDEDVGCDDKVGCDCAEMLDGSNKWINCTYKVLLVRIEADSIIMNEPINNA
jgi:hypothetical protein